jgi:putative transposase
MGGELLEFGERWCALVIVSFTVGWQGQMPYLAAMLCHMALVKVRQAYRFALDPSPAQERMLRSHAGAARYA